MPTDHPIHESHEMRPLGTPATKIYQCSHCHALTSESDRDSILAQACPANKLYALEQRTKDIEDMIHAAKRDQQTAAYVQAHTPTLEQRVEALERRNLGL